MGNLNYQVGSTTTFVEFIGDIETLLTATGVTLFAFPATWAVTDGTQTLFMSGSDLAYFDMDGIQVPVSGTITGFQLHEGGSVLMDWSGLSIPVADVLTALAAEGSGATAALETLLLSVNTTVAGNNDAQVHLETDLISGVAPFGGDDTFILLGGDDNYHAGAGNDTMFGGDGDDTLFGGTGADSIYGGADDDTLSGGTGLNALFGGTGEDTALFAGSFDVDNVTFAADGSFTSVTSAGGVVDTLDSIEVLEFASGEVITMVPVVGGEPMTLTIVDGDSEITGAINPDGSGDNYLTERVFDDGRELVVTYNTDATWYVTQKAIEDVDDAYFWDTRELNYDEAGVLTSSVTVRDDGIEAERTYFEGLIDTLVFTDTENATNWETKTTQYDPIGGVASQKIVYDSGYEVVESFFLGLQIGLDLFDGGNSFDWTSKSFFYNPDGSVGQSVVEFDDGREATTEYVDGVRTTTITNDFEDIYDRDTLITTYDAEGNIVSREQGFDGFITDDDDFPPIEEVFRVASSDFDLG